MNALQHLKDILTDLSATSKGDDIALDGLEILAEIEKDMLLVKKTLTTITG